MINKPLQPAIRGFPTGYDSEVRKRCQQSLGRAILHMGQSSYTSFRIESKDLFHNSGTVWFTGCFQRPETNRHFSSDCDNRFLFTARVSPYSIELGQEYRVFTNSSPSAFYEPGSNILETLAGDPSSSNPRGLRKSCCLLRNILASFA
jgi:hypothetical protein